MWQNRLKLSKKSVFYFSSMYRYTETIQNTVEDFEFPASFHLNDFNRWVILSKLIPWSKFEKEYAVIFHEKMGAPAKPFRMAFGSLIIQQVLNITDSETIKQIQEKENNKKRKKKSNQKAIKIYREKFRIYRS